MALRGTVASQILALQAPSDPSRANQRHDARPPDLADGLSMFKKRRLSYVLFGNEAKTLRVAN